MRRQDMKRLEEIVEAGAGVEAAAMLLPTPRSATVAPLTARAPMPSHTAAEPTAHSIPPTTMNRPSSQPSGPGFALGSARRAACTPRDYIVEVLSPGRAHELVASATTPRGTLPPPWVLTSQLSASNAKAAEKCSPSSPPIMLRPLAEVEPLAEVAGEDAESCGSVSDSSSEGELMNRLRQGLPKEATPDGSRDCAPEAMVQKTGVPRLTVPKLAFSIPTPVRSRFSAASSPRLSAGFSDSDDSDSDDGLEAAEVQPQLQPVGHSCRDVIA